MNILFFLPSLSKRGGVEQSTVTLLNSLVKNTSNHVFLLVLNYNKSNVIFKLDKDIIILDLKIVNYKKQFFTLIKRVRKEIKTHNITHFITVETMGLLFTFIPFFTLKHRPKFIVWEHFNFYNNNGRRLRDFFRKLAARYADLLVTLTVRDVDSWKENLKIKHKISHIYNISPFEEENSTYDIGSKKVISVGRYVDVKGFDRLINAWSIFEKKYNIYDWELSIIGYGALKDSLQELITSLGCKSISLVDGSIGVIDQYKEASIYCMASYHEGLPMVLIEAQSFGLPAISFDIYAGPSEILGCGSGILVEDGNLEAYADAIYTLANSSQARVMMSTVAIANKHRFDSTIIAQEWVNQLENL